MACKVCHITTAHTRYDVRIFLKQCSSLASSDFDTSLIVSDPDKDEVEAGVHIYSIGKNGGKFDRIFKRSLFAYKKAKQLKAAIYHIHDPEIFWLAPFLRSRDSSVVLDLHEDFPAQIKSKKFIPKFWRPLVSWGASMYEKACFSFADGLVTATPHIKKINNKNNPNIIVVNNYPVAEEFGGLVDWKSKERAICYVGGLTQIRGIEYFVEAVKGLDITLYIAGPAQDEFSKSLVTKFRDTLNIVYLGRVGRDEVNNILSRSIAGIVTYLPEPNHVFAMPNKLFEYMSAGIPVIASNFEVWEEIISSNNCGVTVDPTNVQQLREAMQFMVKDYGISEAMGERGKQLVNNQLNWNQEKNNLIDFYNSIYEKKSRL